MFDERSAYLYQNQTILLATKHSKERVIAPLFANELNAHIFVPNDYDTDQFGTFSGERPRTKSAVETCIAKATQAARKYGFSFAIASEGSFGPHPQYYLMPADTEIVAFIDLKHNYVISEQHVSPKTNFSHATIGPEDKFTDFLEQIGFPKHGLVIKDLSNDTILAKGIDDYPSLDALTTTFFANYPQGKLHLETDMRAMKNPTRMEVIQEVTQKLVKRLNSYCPKCSTPGFGVLSTSGFLPCQQCGGATTLFKELIKGCICCNYHQKMSRPDRLIVADPGKCHHCNP